MSSTDPSTGQKNSQTQFTVLVALSAILSVLILAGVIVHLISDALAPLLIIIVLELIVVGFLGYLMEKSLRKKPESTDE